MRKKHREICAISYAAKRTDLAAKHGIAAAALPEHLSVTGSLYPIEQTNLIPDDLGVGNS